MKYHTEVLQRRDSSGESVRITFENGNSVMMYPNATRDKQDGVLLVNVCTSHDCVAAVRLHPDGSVDGWIEK